MPFTSLHYFLLLVVGVVVYYIIPKKIRWIWLLILSYYYYMSFEPKVVLVLVFVTLVTYGATIWLSRINDSYKIKIKEAEDLKDNEAKKELKKRLKSSKRKVLILMLLLDFASLVFLKYANFTIDNINLFIKAVNSDATLLRNFNFIIPLGISFYTFQSAGYIIDIYWDKYAVEKNFFKLALFLGWFPSLMQGPISRYDKVSKTLFAGNDYDLRKLEFGAQKILWGLFKKLVIADRAAVTVKYIVNNNADMDALACILVLIFYTLQLYGDFSGGIDIVRGSAELFGVEIGENFRQPFFAKSIAEFWRRWHISLGKWMKDYVFYPFSLSKAMSRFGKWCKKHFKGNASRALPLCLGNLLVFFIVGIWHGAAWRYIAYGFYNGIIIAASELLKPVYDWGADKLHINRNAKPWKAFMVVRTFILVNIGWIFDIYPDMATIGSMFAGIFTRWGAFSWSNIYNLYITKMGLVVSDYIILVLATIAVIVVGVLQEKKIDVREAVANRNIVIRWLIYYCLVMAIFLVGYGSNESGFIYANF